MSISSLEGTSSGLMASQLSVNYSMAMTKKCMDTAGLAAEEMLEMLPPTPSKGTYIDTYA